MTEENKCTLLFTVLTMWVCWKTKKGIGPAHKPARRTQEQLWKQNTS